MTNNQFLTECKFIANEVMKLKYTDLDSTIDKSIMVLKRRRKDQARANCADFKSELFDHYAKQYKPLVRWMVIALENKENFK
jgi:hypothetical protein